MIRTFARPVFRFLKGEAGVTAVECALLLALVVVICLVALGPAAARPQVDGAVTVAIER